LVLAKKAGTFVALESTHKIEFKFKIKQIYFSYLFFVGFINLKKKKMLLSKHKKNQNAGKKRLLISVNVLGSAGPIRFVVNEEQLVAAVIDTALKSYAREGRLPVLGSDLKDFFLYCPLVGSDALSPWETIGSQGARNFMLCKKPQQERVADNNARASSTIPRRGSGGGSWKSWIINKSLLLKIH
jgi:hypothetical protein